MTGFWSRLYRRANGKKRHVQVAAALVATALSLPTTAHACGPEIVVSFTEAAPDTIHVRNDSEQWNIATLTLDLTPSRGGLFFDTLWGGDGYAMAQPFQMPGGTAELATAPAVSDGDAIMVLLFNGFAPGEEFRFGIDLDDRLINSEWGQNQIVGNEILGARVNARLRADDGREITAVGVFNDQSVAELTSLSCV